MALTKLDLQRIELLIDERIAKLEGKLEQWRNDFYTKIDPILKEVVDNREERTILSRRVSDNTDRIEKLDQSVFKS